ncbi:MAG: hypothetical protein M1827_003012 [Pycnora praestabilis]|nr:MAG: hypothetical protein M1827_003012 [Pycnora praestabilis]
MEAGIHIDNKEQLVFLERKSLCVNSHKPGVTAHTGDPGFRDAVQRSFSLPENNAAEQLVNLKAELKRTKGPEFWTLLMEGMTAIAGSQFGFVGKRILFDDEDSAVEMPPLGEPGSCLMGLAFYYNDGHGIKGMHHNYKYLAYGSPCEHMRHDKVFCVPERLAEFVTDNPNKPRFATDAYLGIPLFADDKCFAHFGMMWSPEGTKNQSLSWGYLEMFMHSLEDLIQQRILEGDSFTKTPNEYDFGKVIPKEAIAVSQSLKPYARSLSHELRTPMQGVVGMLDVMHATVQEAMEGQGSSQVRRVFQALRENIEVVQDSSRRAVEAADNVVHAYDLNMEVPDTPTPPLDEGTEDFPGQCTEKRPNILIEGTDIPIKHSNGKRRRSPGLEWSYSPAVKHKRVEPVISSSRHQISPRSWEPKMTADESDAITSAPRKADHGTEKSTILPYPSERNQSVNGVSDLDSEGTAVPGLRYTNLRELLRELVSESLRVGGRPDSAIAVDTEYGEDIEVRTRTSSGDARTTLIEWSVDPSVPDHLLVDERDLTKLVSCVFLNAVKFTERGKVVLKATLSPKSRYIVINVKDTGSGIPRAFLPYLFKPFSREDDSLTRQKEGLGLGLLVAKGLVRKIGGDLLCVRSETSGINRGSEFELRVPVAPLDSGSRPSTPHRTPTPSNSNSRISSDPDPLALVEGRLSRDRQFSAQALHAADQSERRWSLQATQSFVGRSPDVLPKASSPLLPSSPSRRNSTTSRQGSTKKSTFDRRLAQKHPLTFLVAEDNKINRRLLVNMLSKLGYTDIHEAYDGVEAVRQMTLEHRQPIDVILMDLWMPSMDGYEATEKILSMDKYKQGEQKVTVLAVSADVTGEALERAAKVGMEGFMTKPYKLLDLERLILEYCANKATAV